MDIASRYVKCELKVKHELEKKNGKLLEQKLHYDYNFKKRNKKMRSQLKKTVSKKYWMEMLN